MALRGAAGGAGSGAAAADSGAASGPRNGSKGAPRGPDAARCGSARRLRSSEAGRSPAGEKCVDGHERLEMRHDQHLSSGGGAWCSQRRGGKPQGESRARWPMSLGARCGQRGAVPQRSREPASPCPQTPWARGQTRAWGMGWRVSHAPERSAPLRCVRRGRDARPICTGVRDAACPLSTGGRTGEVCASISRMTGSSRTACAAAPRSGRSPWQTRALATAEGRGGVGVAGGCDGPGR